MRLSFLKSLLPVGLLTCCFSGCNTPSADCHVRHDKESGYTIITDTITLDANEYISKVHQTKINKVESYRGRYICQFFHQNYTSFVNYMNLGVGHFLLSISKDGQDIIQMPAPMEFCEWDDEITTIKVLNDTLYCYNLSKNFYWNEDAQQWIASNKEMSNDYDEDDTYAIYSEDRGEWGEFTRFHEKQTGVDYLFLAPMITAQLIDNDYYIVGAFQFSKVSDPHRGWIMNDSIKYGKWASVAPFADIVYGPKFGSSYEFAHSERYSRDTLFCSGFMRTGQLHFLMRGSEDTFIAKYAKDKKGPIEKVLSLGNIPVIYSQGRKNRDELTFYFKEDWTQDGLLNIDKDTIRITYIKKLSDTLQYRGVQALEQIIDFAANNTGKATLSEVKALEEKTGGIHDGLILETNWMGNPSSDYRLKLMGPGHVLLDFEKDIEGDHELVNFFHAIDEFDSFCIGYCYQKETQILTTVWIELYSTNYLDNEYKYRRDGHLALDSVVTQCLSVSPDSKGVWHKGDVTISTYGGKNRFVIRTKQP